MRQTKYDNILHNIRNKSPYKDYVDFSIPIPEPFQGREEIRLIILGQDPTVKNADSRKKIKVVLNLDKKGALRNYITTICQGLNVQLDNVYATNIIKNFFIKPPAMVKETNLLVEFVKYWNEVLQGELNEFDNVPIIVLGQPILKAIVCPGNEVLVKNYWGFTKAWKLGENNQYLHINEASNILNRRLYPFPHQPSIIKEFYKINLPGYLSYMRELL